MSRIVRSYRDRKEISGCPGLGDMKGWRVTAKGYRVSFGGDGNVFKLIVVAAQLYEYIKSH